MRLRPKKEPTFKEMMEQIDRDCQRTEWLCKFALGCFAVAALLHLARLF